MVSGWVLGYCGSLNMLVCTDPQRTKARREVVSGRREQMQRSPGKSPSVPLHLCGPPLPRDLQGRSQDLKIQVGN